MATYVIEKNVPLPEKTGPGSKPGRVWSEMRTLAQTMKIGDCVKGLSAKEEVRLRQQMIVLYGKGAMTSRRQEDKTFWVWRIDNSDKLATVAATHTRLNGQAATN